jgi:hypothetical protein
MRTTVALLVVLPVIAAAVLVGCRTPPLDHPIVDDFGVITQPQDLAGIKNMPDLPVETGNGCNALIMCLFNCQDQQCQNDCYTKASTDAQNLLNDALTCVYDHCLMRDGNRAPRCVQDPSGNFVDPSDGGLGVCDKCLNNAFAELGGYPCMPADDPDCSPKECSPTVQSCLSM